MAGGLRQACLACRCKAEAVEHFDQTMQGVTWEGTGWEVDPVRQQLTQELDEFEAQLRKGKVCLPCPDAHSTKSCLHLAVSV